MFHCMCVAGLVMIKGNTARELTDGHVDNMDTYPTSPLCTNSSTGGQPPFGVLSQIRSKHSLQYVCLYYNM